MLNSRQPRAAGRLIRACPTGPPAPTTYCFARRLLRRSHAHWGDIGLGGRIRHHVRRGRGRRGRRGSLSTHVHSSRRLAWRRRGRGRGRTAALRTGQEGLQLESQRLGERQSRPAPVHR
eukprot:7663437-Alexandrium_andersonii.AAC.1